MGWFRGKHHVQLNLTSGAINCYNNKLFNLTKIQMLLIKNAVFFPLNTYIYQREIEQLFLWFTSLQEAIHHIVFKEMWRRRRNINFRVQRAVTLKHTNITLDFEAIRWNVIEFEPNLREIWYGWLQIFFKIEGLRCSYFLPCGSYVSPASKMIGSLSDLDIN